MARKMYCQTYEMNSVICTLSKKNPDRVRQDMQILLDKKWLDCVATICSYIYQELLNWTCAITVKREKVDIDYFL